MTVFRQENLEEHYETGEDLGRWVRADGAVTSERGGARAGSHPRCLSTVSEVPKERKGFGFEVTAPLPF